MVSAKTELDTKVPPAFRAVPLHPVTDDNPLRLCVLVRQRPDPVAGNFVLLRDLADASVYLACTTDAAGRVWSWIELWVQNPDKLNTSLRHLREHLANDELDARWTSFCETFRDTDPDNHFCTGWEQAHPTPLFLDVSLNSSAPASTKTGEGRWKLCTDDAALTAAALPPYSTSLSRYLWVPGDAATRFVPAVPDIPENERTAKLAEVIKNTDQLLPFNPHCGLMMARAFAPLTLEDYFDVLGGKPWSGIDQSETPLPLNEFYRALENPTAVQQSGAHLFLGLHGRAGRVLEAFHLKVQLLTDIIRQVRAFVQRHGLPFLNLSGDSFRVKLNGSGAGLPFLWTAETLLARPSQAFALPVETSDFRYFLPARSDTASIYLPEGAGQALQSVGTVRLRKVLPPERGLTVIEGTLVLQDRIVASANDLLWMRLNVQNARVDLYGHLYAAEGLAHGEGRFRTVPQKLPDAIVTALRAAEGVSFARTSFDIVPLMSSPCDLYSLGVLAARALLVNEETTLAVAVDELLSLARQVGRETDGKQELKWRVKKVFESDKRWNEALGPHHLVWSGVTAEQAASVVPSELWCEALGAVARLFPGMGPDSVCKDFGDAPSLALETVFNEPANDFERLLRRSRSLIVIDWKYNREIHDVISACLEKV